MITGHCISCLGSGYKKVKDQIGVTRPVPCDECKGLGGTLMKEGSGEHRIAAAIGTMKKHTEKPK